MNVGHLVAADGYWALFALVGLECVGIPLPGEAILIAAGTYAGQTHKLSVWLIWLVAAAAASLGGSLGYWVGVKGGFPLLLRFGKYIRVKESELKVGRYVFDRWGGWVVFGGRFVAVLRTYAAFLAGTNRMSWRKFAPFNAAAAVAWAALWSFLSYSVGNSLKHSSATVNVVVGIAAVIALGSMIVIVHRQSKKLAAVAEAAYPGPLE